MAAFVLVHSPSTWRWVADELVARGHQVTVPSVPPAATALGWSAFVGALAAGLDSPVLVGHSGAGPGEGHLAACHFPLQNPLGDAVTAAATPVLPD
jgi:hypothetical protein